MVLVAGLLAIAADASSDFASSPLQWAVGGAVTALLTAAALLVVRLIRIGNQQVELYSRPATEAHAEIVALRAQNARCEWRLNMLIRACQRAEIPIPEEIWRDDGGP